MSSDGTNSYSWDAENRLLQITYPGSGNNSQFVYDGFGANVKILEYTGGSLTSTKQFVWNGCNRSEARNSSGAITAQYFARGQTISGSGYLYLKDHLGSIREMTDTTGVIQAEYNYDTYGRASQLQGTLASDFQYAGYYCHARSGLSLTATREYSPGLGRFISRDSIAERGGLNLFAYVQNTPIGSSDASGQGPIPAQPTTCCECQELADLIRRKTKLLIVKTDDIDSPEKIFTDWYGINTITMNPNTGRLYREPGGHTQVADELQQGLTKDVVKYRKYCLKLCPDIMSEEELQDVDNVIFRARRAVQDSLDWAKENGYPNGYPPR